MDHKRKPLYSLEELKELGRRFKANEVLKRNAYQNIPLAFETAYLVGVFALSPYRRELREVFSEVDKSLVEKQAIALLCSLHNKATYERVGASEQIAGIVAAVFDWDIGLSENGYLLPNLNLVMDNCGMGGDLFRTPNVSTIAAIIASADEIAIAKHGSPGNTDAIGSSDFLEYLGVNLYPEKRKVEEALERFFFGYTDALDTRYKMIHIQTHRSARLAHMNDIIGPITNPVHPKLLKKRVLGVNHLIKPETVAKAYLILNRLGVTNLEHGLFVRGFISKDKSGGIDEISVFGKTIVAELKGTKVETYEIFPEDFGILAGRYYPPPEGKEKARFGEKILKNEITDSARDLILANTAALEYLARGINFKEGFERTKVILESGRPLENLRRYCNFTK